MLYRSSVLLVAVVASVSLASAQSASVLDSLTESCKNTLQSVLVAPEAQCLNAGSILSFALSSSNKSVPTFASTLLTGLCSSGMCPNSTIATIVTNITSGCAEDLSNFGIDISNQVVLDYAQTFYPTVRQIACLKDDGANQLCVPETLSNLENVIGTLGVDDLQWDNLVEKVQKLITSDIANLACTGCIKEAYTIAAGVFPFPDLLAKASPAITDTCGTSFIDGKDVDGVSQTANDTSVFQVDQQSNNALSFKPVALLGAMGAVALSVFLL